MSKSKNVSVIEVALKSGLSPIEVLQCLGTDHVKDGYRSNIGRGRCIRKNGSFDYLKMSSLVHNGDW